MPLPAYIPLHEHGGDGTRPSQQQQQQQGREAEEEEGGETMEEYALRQIRDLNAATRERPQDVGLWVRYAAFQDEAFQLLGSG